MSSVLLYGGTFNPIHKGHLAICQSAKRELGIGRVVLMPAAIPPHKEAPDLAGAGHRLAICKTAAATMEGVAVDDFELQQGGVSYTVHTLEHLGETYPGAELFLLMGSDMFLTFRQWHRWEEVGQMATLVVGAREKNDRIALEAAREEFHSLGIKAVLLEHPALEMSSTQIRRELADKGSSGNILPETMIYIRYHGLYGTGAFSCPGKVDEGLQQMLREYIKPLMGPERFTHSLGVEEEAVRLARIHGADVKKAAVAGLLHDVCKEMDREEMLQMISRSGIIRDIDFAAQPQLIHGHAAPLFVARRLGIDDKEILDAIRFHTTARAGMTRLEQVVYLADLTSQDRDYPDMGEMRRLAERSMEEGLLHALQYMIDHLKQKGRPICRDTMEAFFEYSSQDGGTQ